MSDDISNMEYDLDPLKKWDYFLNRLDETKGVSRKSKEKLAEGLQKLRQVLGEDWLPNAIEEHHPIFAGVPTLLNRAYWAQCYYAKLGRTLCEVSGSPNFENVVNRIRKKEEYSCALAEVEAFHIFSEMGLRPRFVATEPESQTPDLEIRYDNLQMPAEVTVVGPSKAQLIQQRRFNALSQAVTVHFDVDIAVIVKRRLSQRHTKKIVQRIAECVQRAKLEWKVVQYREEGTVEMCCAPSELSIAVHRWRQSHNLQEDSYLIYPETRRDLPRRIANRIRKKAHEQIPSSSPGLVFISLGPFYFNRMKGVISSVEETLYDLDNAVFCILRFWYLSGDKKKRCKVHNTGVVEKTFCQLYREVISCSPNRYSPLWDKYESKLKDLAKLLIK